MKFNKLTLVFTSICLIFAQTSFASRFGGGRNYGMSRSISKPSYNNYGNYSQQRYSQPQPVHEQPRSGMGAGTAAALGAAAGVAGGYMLGKSMADNNTNNVNASNVKAQAATETTATQNHIPWGTIAILAVLLLLGLMLFRRKANPSLSNNNNDSSMNNYNQPTNFNIPSINRNSMANPLQSGYQTASMPVQNNNTANSMDKMPDGVETIYFLRQVKGMFLHIQSMNNSDNIAEIEKYMTAELYQEIKAEVLNNNFIADFANLDCQLLDCEFKDNQLIASVKFFGLVSEEPNKPAQPFSEIWNFVKSELTGGKWLVAGIQQENML